MSYEEEDTCAIRIRIMMILIRRRRKNRRFLFRVSADDHE